MDDPIRCLYLDLDSTLLGRGASLLHDGDGLVCMEGVRAIQACLRADVEIVLMSGRRRAQLQEDATLFGQRSYIFEAGACVVLEGEEHWLTGDLMPGELTIAEQIERSGAPDLLLERYEGRLEYHEPWHTAREVSHLFRGLVDAGEVDGLLVESGHGNLRLLDNGVVTRRSPALAGLEQVRGYHLLPAAASKANAVAFHRRVMGYEREQTFAVGDSREDLACAAHVGSFWLVANAVERDPSLAVEIAASASPAAGIAEGSSVDGEIAADGSRLRQAGTNVRVAREGYGRGVYEAVVETLMAPGGRGHERA